MPRGSTDNDERIEPGTSMADQWEPYKLWIGDLWECQGCKAQIVIGISLGSPVAEHFQPDFKDKVAMLNATFQVNDC